jgi:hypothetical protein
MVANLKKTLCRATRILKAAKANLEQLTDNLDPANEDTVDWDQVDHTSLVIAENLAMIHDLCKDYQAALNHENHLAKMPPLFDNWISFVGFEGATDDSGDSAG